MYPNKPTNYLEKARTARKVAAVAITVSVISVLFTIGYAKTTDKALESADRYQYGMWQANEKIDSLNHVISMMDCDNFKSKFNGEY